MKIINLILVGILLNACSSVDCETTAEWIKNDEFNIVVQKNTSLIKRFYLEGYNPETQNFEKFESDAYFYATPCFNSNLGDTISKEAGNLEVIVHSIDTTYSCQFRCGGTTLN